MSLVANFWNSSMSFGPKFCFTISTTRNLMPYVSVGHLKNLYLIGSFRALNQGLYSNHFSRSVYLFYRLLMLPKRCCVRVKKRGPKWFRTRMVGPVILSDRNRISFNRCRHDLH